MMKKKVKKPSLTKLKKTLWDLCKTIIRTRDGSECVICGAKNLAGGNWQTGHFIPSSTCGSFLRYDIRNLHSNCMRCNIICGGNGALYYRALVSKYGEQFVDGIFKDKGTYVKADVLFYEEKIKLYKEISCWESDKLLDYTRILGGQTTKGLM